ncbi:MAG: 38, APCd [Rubritepida sp.]|nr:38, APCd [Rubritepida sp.]
MSLAGTTARMLARFGRGMVLQRRIGKTEAFTSATRLGKESAYKPTELVGLVQQGDLKVIIGPDLGAIAAPLKKPDRILIDGIAYTIQGAIPRYAGAVVDGYELWVRGG